MAGTTTYYGISYPTSTDYVKDGATAMQTIATGFDSAVAIPTYNNQTGTTYTFALADTGKTVTASNASASTYTIPPQSSVAWASGATLTVRNLGAGVVTFAGGVGVTVTNTAATLAQYTSAKLIRTGSDAWTVVPESAPSGLTLVKSQVVGTNVASVTVTSCFNSTYDNYKIIYSGGVMASNTSDIKIQLSSITSGYYSNAIYNDFGATGTAAPAGYRWGNTSAWEAAGAGSTLTGTVNMDISNPNLAVCKIMSSTYIRPGTVTSSTTGYTTGFVNSTTQATGFVMSGASNFTGGTIYVYGYQK